MSNSTNTMKQTASKDCQACIALLFLQYPFISPVFILFLIELVLIRPIRLIIYILCIMMCDIIHNTLPLHVGQ